MSYDWQRSHNRPDFTRSGNDTGGGRMLWLFVAVAALAALVLISAFSYGPTPVEHPGGGEAVQSGEVGTTGATDTTGTTGTTGTEASGY